MEASNSIVISILSGVLSGLVAAIATVFVFLSREKLLHKQRMTWAANVLKYVAKTAEQAIYDEPASASHIEMSILVPHVPHLLLDSELDEYLMTVLTVVTRWKRREFWLEDSQGLAEDAKIDIAREDLLRVGRGLEGWFKKQGTRNGWAPMFFR